MWSGVFGFDWPLLNELRSLPTALCSLLFARYRTLTRPPRSATLGYDFPRRNLAKHLATPSWSVTMHQPLVIANRYCDPATNLTASKSSPFTRIPSRRSLASRPSRSGRRGYG